MQLDEISVQALAALIQTKQPFFLLDVRTPEEYQAFNLGGTLIPLNTLAEHLEELPKDKLIVVHCRSGHRSHQAQVFLAQAGFQNVKNLTGGILAWQHEFGEAQLR